MTVRPGTAIVAAAVAGLLGVRRFERERRSRIRNVTPHLHAGHRPRSSSTTAPAVIIREAPRRSACSSTPTCEPAVPASWKRPVVESCLPGSRNRGTATSPGPASSRTSRSTPSAAGVADGMPEGDPDHLPPRPRNADGWQLGEPDLVVRMPQPYTLPPGDADVFRNFVIPVTGSETRHVRTIRVAARQPPVRPPRAAGRRRDAHGAAPRRRRPGAGIRRDGHGRGAHAGRQPARLDTRDASVPGHRWNGVAATAPDRPGLAAPPAAVRRGPDRAGRDRFPLRRARRGPRCGLRPSFWMPTNSSTSRRARPPSR